MIPPRGRGRAASPRVGGFRFAGIAAGLKKNGEEDVALFVADRTAAIAGAFTTNRFLAAPVLLARPRARGGKARAVIVNTVSANAGTGRRGLADARLVCRETARRLGVPVGQVLPCSTGKIGIPMPMPALRRGVALAIDALRPDGLRAAARAIRTTDAFEKLASRRIRGGGAEVTIAGIAKGAGMIHPRMATTLAFLFTDAAIGAPHLREILGEALAGTLNAISVDGDTSTNDTALFLASGASDVRVRPRSRLDRDLRRAATEVLAELAEMIVLDGEGASRIAKITVIGAENPADADRAARAIGNSILFKAALAGADPNWGRILAALGTSGVRLNPGRTEIRIGDVAVFANGSGTGAASASRARRAMQARKVGITIRIGRGRGRAALLVSDLTPGYVRFNSEYSS